MFYTSFQIRQNLAAVELEQNKSGTALSLTLRTISLQCLGEGKLWFQTGADGALLAFSGKSI